MPSTGYGYFLSRVMEPVSPTSGESGYFSVPVETLDPHLFDGETIKPDVRTWVLNTLYSFWGQRYEDPKAWSTAWIAGSGITYQWAAARGNGDLDILIGVDFNEFFQRHPKFAGLTETDMAAVFNQEFHQHLWPRTAEQNINGQTYEVTFYVNPNSTDIRTINPYAAYDLSHNRWTVRPPTGDAFKHPQAFYGHAEAEARQARMLVERYNQHATQAKSLPPGSPGWFNTMRYVDLLASQAADLFDSIHLGRKQAFAPGGSGYGDYYNFRWQYHKQQGTAQALNAVAHAHKSARDEYNTQVYGAPISSAEQALRQAALWNRGANGR